MPPPGGDVIGRRRLDPHFDAMRALGATIEHGREIELTAPAGGLTPCDFLMDEPSVMATENALMAAALTPGTTTIRNAASEPHVQDLARMLVAMGAVIDGIGSNVMNVHGQDRLHGCTHTIAPDHIEIGSFMALAGVTGGELVVKDTVPERSADDPARVRAARAAQRGRGHRRDRPRRTAARNSERRRRIHVEDPGRTVARVPSRPDERGAWRSRPRRAAR